MPSIIVSIPGGSRMLSRNRVANSWLIFLKEKGLHPAFHSLLFCITYIMRSIKEGRFRSPGSLLIPGCPVFHHTETQNSRECPSGHFVPLAWGLRGTRKRPPFCLTACFVEDKRPQHSACSTPRFREWFDSYRAGSGDLLFPARCLKRPSCVCSFRDYSAVLPLFQSDRSFRF